MAFIRAWNRHDLFTSLYTSVVTGATDINTQPTLLFYILCTHGGGASGLAGSGARVEIYDGGTATGTLLLHLESPSGDRLPFGISLMKPILCSAGLSLAVTATAFNGSLGYYNYSA